MKFSAVLIAIVLSSALHGYVGGAFSEIIGFETSAVNAAMGYAPVGVVNIWHNDPLATIRNPAIGAFHEGLSWGSARQKYMGWENDIKQNNSQIDLYQDGIGVSISGLNLAGKIGNYFDYGGYTVTDMNGHEYKVDTDYEASMGLGFAVDITEILIMEHGDELPYLQYTDLALGVSFNYLKLVRDPVYSLTNGQMTSSSFKSKGWALNTGGIFRLHNTWEDMIHLEGIYGLYHHNVARSETTSSFSDGSTPSEDPIGFYRSQGFGFGASLLADKYLGNTIDNKYVSFDNLLSIRGSYGIIDPMCSSSDRQKGYGAEIGLLDTIFLRQGHYDDGADWQKGVTKGFGVNLSYRKLIGFRFNYAEFPFGETIGQVIIRDFGVNIDIMSLVKKRT